MHSRQVHTLPPILLRRVHIFIIFLISRRRLSLNQEDTLGRTQLFPHPDRAGQSSEMPRKNSPPQLAIVGSSSARIDEHQQERQNLTTTTDSRSPELNVHIIRSNNERINNNSGPLSPLSPSTPKSPRSPFKFSLKAASYNNNSIKSGRRPSMQASEAQQQQQPQESQQEGREDENRIDLPNSPTSSFHPDSQTQIPSASPEAKRGSQATKRQGKGGFFSNYKASKSSTRVNAHNKPQVSDESMPSREHHQPEMTSKVAVSSAAEAKRNGMTRPLFHHALTPNVKGTLY